MEVMVHCEAELELYFWVLQVQYAESKDCVALTTRQAVWRPTLVCEC